MNRSKITIYFAIGGALLVTLFAVIYLLIEDPATRQFRELQEKPVSVRNIDEDVLSGMVYSAGEEGVLLREGELSFEQIVALLRQKYGASIENARVQVAMIEELMGYLRKKYPGSWVQNLQEILLAAFPERAAELFRLSENLYLYAREIDRRRDLLGRLTREERQDLLWDIRAEYFGASAEDIWHSERQLQGVQQTLGEIAENTRLSLPDKLAAYRRALEDTFGNQLPATLERRQLNFVNAFTDAVRADLAALNPDERDAALREIRASLGMTPDAIERWARLDHERDRRWSNGEAYMNRRQAIESSYTGAEREAALDELRQELFGDEAAIIKQEEASGYFRFEQERRYGRE